MIVSQKIAKITPTFTPTFIPTFTPTFATKSQNVLFPNVKLMISNGLVKYHSGFNI